MVEERPIDMKDCLGWISSSKVDLDADSYFLFHLITRWNEELADMNLIEYPKNIDG